MIISELISELEEALKKEGDIPVGLCVEILESQTIEHWAYDLMVAHAAKDIDWLGEEEKYFIISAVK